MRIIVKAKTRAKTEKVERLNQPSLNFGPSNTEIITYKVWVKEAPVAGKANEAIIRVLAEYFKTKQSNVRLLSGQTAKQKIFEIY